MGEVVELNVPTTLEVPPSNVLNGALKAEMREVLVVGIDKDGAFYMAASKGELGENLLLVEAARDELLSHYWDT